MTQSSPDNLDTSIATCVRQTVKLFSQFQNHQLQTILNPRFQSTIEDVKHLFYTWAANVGALAPEKASLDHRLKDEPDFVDLLRSMLHRLNRDLGALLATPLDSLREEDEEDTVEEVEYIEEAGDMTGRHQCVLPDCEEGLRSGESENTSTIIDEMDRTCQEESMDKQTDCSLDSEKSDRRKDGDNPRVTKESFDVENSDDDSTTIDKDDTDESLADGPNEYSNSHDDDASNLRERTTISSIQDPEAEFSSSSDSSDDSDSSYNDSIASFSDDKNGSTTTITLRYVKKTIDQLLRLNVVLRKPASSSENSRVRVFMRKQGTEKLLWDAFGNPVYGLRENISWKIREFLPGLPDAVKTRMMESFIFRKLMVLYRERHQRKLAQGTELLLTATETESEQIPSGIGDSGYENQLLMPTGDGLASDLEESGFVPSFRELQPYPHTPRSSSVTGQTLSATEASSANVENYPKYAKSILGSALSSVGIRRRKQLVLPRMLRLMGSSQENSGTHFMCQFCYNLVPKSENEEPKRSDHILKDLKPYVCLFPECDQPDPYFRTSNEWLSHMQAHAHIWHCPVPNTLHRECYKKEFLTRGQLVEHLTSEYHNDTGLSEIQVLRLVDTSTVSKSDVFGVLAMHYEGVSPDDCLMCKKPVASLGSFMINEANVTDTAGQEAFNLYNHILLHFEDFALKSLEATGDLSELYGNRDEDGTSDRFGSASTAGHQTFSQFGSHSASPLEFESARGGDRPLFDTVERMDDNLSWKETSTPDGPNATKLVWTVDQHNSQATNTASSMRSESTTNPDVERFSWDAEKDELVVTERHEGQGELPVLDESRMHMPPEDMSWTKQEDEIVKDRKLEFSDLREKLPHRSNDEIWVRMAFLRCGIEGLVMTPWTQLEDQLISDPSWELHRLEAVLGQNRSEDEIRWRMKQLRGVTESEEDDPILHSFRIRSHLQMNESKPIVDTNQKPDEVQVTSTTSAQQFPTENLDVSNLHEGTPADSAPDLDPNTSTSKSRKIPANTLDYDQTREYLETIAEEDTLSTVTFKADSYQTSGAGAQDDTVLAHSQASPPSPDPRFSDESDQQTAFLYVNAKQFHRIIKRREARQKLEEFFRRRRTRSEREKRHSRVQRAEPAV